MTNQGDSPELRGPALDAERTSLPVGQRLVIDHQGAATAPASEVPGARRGGSVTLLADAPPEHMDPAQTYIGTTLAVATAFFHRALTGYVEDPDNGVLTLVGDLATDAGRTLDGGLTWTYTLRDGLAFEDGTPISSADVAHAVARSFSELGDYGPQFIQRALDPERTYRGPGQDGRPAPGVTTPDARTIVFRLSEPYPDFPFFAATTTTTPVPADRAPGAEYETTWLSTGPYRRKEEQPGEYILLERNPHWSPASDPIRRQYVDEVRWEFGVDRTAQTERLAEPTEADATSIATTDVAPADILAIQVDPRKLERVLDGPTAYAMYVYINTQRVPDPDVRRALIYAFDRDSYVEAAGGPAAAEPATTILAPLLPGYRPYDAYPTGPNGDPEKAKQLLAGKEVPKLRYAFQDIAPLRKLAPVVKTGLERAGFEIELVPVDRAAYYSTVGRRDTDVDLIWGVWGPDFPDPAGVMDVLFRGDRLAETGNMNLSYFDDPEISRRLAALGKETDRSAAAQGYAELDREIMTEHAPLIPVFYKRQFSLVGPQVGGLFISSLYSFPNLTRVHVKS
ncbi:ABC transporter substrate-binding protein [Kitasatospora sp. NPDC096077]|uniref:ABC transporter substrate-binding protein n=1 Tax=Kitasatospora sp. NPDC096077 TaxID=3155544 RepID=UPI0033199A07